VKVGDLVKLNEWTAIGYPETDVRKELGILIESLPIHGTCYHTVLFLGVNKEREFPQHQLEVVSESR
jgi:hypothetical protein